MIECCQKPKRPDLMKVTAGTRFPITWKSSLAKAAEGEVDYAWLHKIADSAAEPLRRRILAAIARIQDGIDEKKLLAAVKRQDVDAVMRALDLDETMQEAFEAAVRPPLEDAMLRAGREAPDRTLGPQVGMRFDLTNPNVTTFLRNYDFRLIRQISEDTREGIRQVVSDAFEYGGHPDEQARAIRGSIGLTQNQATAVDNFRSLLVNRDRMALQRALRDKRFDPTLNRALGRAAERELPKDQIDRMVDRYTERFIAHRANTIARTETIGASNAGQQMSWDQAAGKGLILRDRVRQKWYVTPDDKTCLICESIPILNPEGVPLGAMFMSAAGPIRRPGAHPLCRCVLIITGLNR